LGFSGFLVLVHLFGGWWVVTWGGCGGGFGLLRAYGIGLGFATEKCGSQRGGCSEDMRIGVFFFWCCGGVVLVTMKPSIGGTKNHGVDTKLCPGWCHPATSGAPAHSQPGEGGTFCAGVAALHIKTAITRRHVRIEGGKTPLKRGQIRNNIREENT